MKKQGNKKTAVQVLIVMGLIALDGALKADVKPVQAESFYVTPTEKELGKWLDISLLIEGYPTERGDFKWKLNNPNQGFSDDGTRETWRGYIDVLDKSGAVIDTFLAVCDTSAFDGGLIAGGLLCDLTSTNE